MTHALVRVSLRTGSIVQFPVCAQLSYVLPTGGEPQRLPWDLFSFPTCLRCVVADPWQYRPQPDWLCRVTSTS